MLYPAYVYEGDENTAYGAEFPDFPGCYSAADELKDLPSNFQEAVEVYFDGEDLDLPSPSRLEDLKNDYDGGFWMMADIDLSRISSKTKRINITMPQMVLSRIDRTTDNRSQFLTEAALEKLAHSG
jgi:predicted RNase H-like HicB family nuclease